jgi:hypothetical protein
VAIAASDELMNADAAELGVCASFVVGRQHQVKVERKKQ